MDGESIEKNSKKKYLLCFIGVMIYYFQGISTALNENNTIYALEQINRYDQNIFADNIAVYVDGVSARFFMNWVVSFCMKFSNGSWVGAAVPLIYFGCIILAVATVEMVFHVSEKYRELLVIFFAILIRKNVNTGFPGWGSFEMASLGMGIGFAFAMLAAAQVVGRKQNWTGAWLFLSIATLCHIHEGMWGGVFLVLLFYQVIEKRVIPWKENWTFIVYIVSLGICAFPGIVGESSGITAAEFIDIYAMYRHPHHLVPSVWGAEKIWRAFLVLAGTAFLRYLTICCTNEKNDHKVFLVEAGLSLGAWIGVLCITYVFIEIVPLPVIAVMFIPKFFRYVSILSLLWCIKSVRDFMMDQDYLTAVMLLIVIMEAATMKPKEVLLLYAVAALGIVLVRKFAIEEMKYLPVICTFAMSLWNHPSAVVLYSTLIVLVYMTVLCKKKGLLSEIYNRRLLVVVFLTMVLIYGTEGRFWRWTGTEIALVTSTSYLSNAAGEDIFTLAKEFQQSTNTEAVFLTDPKLSKASWFQLVSERNCFVAWKTIPSNRSLVKEWYRRIEETEALFEKQTGEIVEIMKEEKLAYILVPKNYYKEFEIAKEFKVKNISPNNEYRVYEIDLLKE